MIPAPRNGLCPRVARAIEAQLVATPADVEALFNVTPEKAKNAFYVARRLYLGFRRVDGVWTPPAAPPPPRGPARERGRGERRDDCARYDNCLSAAVRQPRLASSPVRCPRTCAAFEPRDRGAQLLHLAASRPGEGAVP